MISSALEPTTFAAALAVFFTTCYLTWKGWRDEKKKVSQERTGEVAGLVQDDISVHHNTDAVRENTAALQRLTDILLLTGKRK
jgi:hypothetical protein